MKKAVSLKSVVLGTGLPKICVSLMGTNTYGLLEEIKLFKNSAADLAEWRADYFDDLLNPAKVLETLQVLQEVLDNDPLIFTIRRLEEGGQKAISLDAYREINHAVICSGLADAVDLELSAGEHLLKPLIETAHLNKTAVIVSSHDFYQTPPKTEMMRRLTHSMALGADLSKLAVMPDNAEDVLALLEVANQLNHTCDSLIIAIAMSELGTVSRISGEVFGSAMTFASLDKPSAPGQLQVSELKQVLEIIHSANRSQEL